MKKLFNILLFMLITGCFGAYSQTAVEAAAEMLENGDYDGAKTQLEEIVAQSPDNGRAAFMLGSLYLDEGKVAEGKELMLKAIKKDIIEASLVMADVRLKEYDLESARININRYRDKAKKSPDYEANLEALESRLERTEQMLERVRKVTVVDSLTVDASEFFAAYKLSPGSGSIHSLDELPGQIESASYGTFYMPQDGHSMIWPAPLSEDDDIYRLMGSSQLTDGSWEAPQQLGENLNIGGGDVNYPFLMADGFTLYYACNGDDSLGGYDIYITRYNGERYLDPQNMGMPFNSAYNDYLLAIDEDNNMGWWATDRNQIPGKLTIYMFVPEEVRQNYDADTPGLTGLALLKSIRDTWGDEDYTGTYERIGKAIAEAESQKGPRFSITIPGRGVYTTLDDFKSANARAAMSRYLEAQKSLDAKKSEIEEMRAKYAAGNKGVGNSILKGEREILKLEDNLTKLSNEVVIHETRK